MRKRLTQETTSASAPLVWYASSDLSWRVCPFTLNLTSVFVFRITAINYSLFTLFIRVYHSVRGVPLHDSNTLLCFLFRFPFLCFPFLRSFPVFSVWFGPGELVLNPPTLYLVSALTIEFARKVECRSKGRLLPSRSNDALASSMAFYFQSLSLHCELEKGSRKGRYIVDLASSERLVATRKFTLPP